MTVPISSNNKKDYLGLILLMDLCIRPNEREYERSTYDSAVASICASEIEAGRLPVAWFHRLGSKLNKEGLQNLTEADGPLEEWDDYMSGLSDLSKRNLWEAWLRAVTLPLCFV